MRIAGVDGSGPWYDTEMQWIDFTRTTTFFITLCFDTMVHRETAWKLALD
jgi:hypothetical protein